MALAGDTNSVAPMAGWSALLFEATAEVFSMMVGATIAAAENTKVPVLANVTGTVGIAGALCGVLSLRCSTDSAIKMASQMLGIPAEDAVSQQRDAVGEICNIVAGHFKAKVGLGDRCMLSVPTVITGSDYRLHPAAGSERLELPLLYEKQPIWIGLEIRK